MASPFRSGNTGIYRQSRGADRCQRQRTQCHTNSKHTGSSHQELLPFRRQPLQQRHCPPGQQNKQCGCRKAPYTQRKEDSPRPPRLQQNHANPEYSSGYRRCRHRVGCLKEGCQPPTGYRSSRGKCHSLGNPFYKQQNRRSRKAQRHGQTRQYSAASSCRPRHGLFSRCGGRHILFHTIFLLLIFYRNL